MGRTLLSCLLGLSLALLVSTERIERIGNKITPSRSGADNAGSTLLVNDKALSRGRLFAFSAYIRSSNPAVFQIWRETTVTNDFRLVSETRFIPTVLEQREDLYLASQFVGCPLIENGDKLGVFTEQSPAPVAYVFNSQDPTSLINVSPNVTHRYGVGDVITFDPLPFPYLLSLAAYIDTEIDNLTITGDTVECPTNLFIPEEIVPTLPPTTTTTQPTPQPGATGATGPTGFRGAPGTQGRPGEPGLNGTRGPTGPQGDTGVQGIDGAQGVQGPQGFTGAQGPQGSVGPEGPTGPTGPKGDDGEDGEDGMDGKNGRNGVNGTMYIYADGENPDAVTGDDDMWLNSTLIMILVIWLIVVTVILFILTIAFCCYACCRKEKKEAERHPPHAAAAAATASSNGQYVNVGYTGGDEYSSDPDKKQMNRLSSFEPGEGWISTMKQDDTVNYENSTIDREASKKGKPAPLTELEPHVYDDVDDQNGGKKIPKTPDALDAPEEPVAPAAAPPAAPAADTAEVTIEVPPTTPNYPSPPPLPGAEATVTMSADGPASPTTPNARWSQSQDQMIAY